MRTLVLLRHAKSSWALPGVDDFERPLNDRGERDAPRMGGWLASEGFLPDLIVCSSALRTQQTMALAKKAFNREIETIVEPALYLASRQKIVEIVQALPDTARTILLIAHNPGIHDAALGLLSPDARSTAGDLRSKFLTAACAIIQFPVSSWQDVTWNSGALARFTEPRALPQSTG